MNKQREGIMNKLLVLIFAALLMVPGIAGASDNARDIGNTGYIDTAVVIADVTTANTAAVNTSNQLEVKSNVDDEADSTYYQDDADWTDNTSDHQLIGGIYQGTPHSITDGDTGPISLTANGFVKVSDGGTDLNVEVTETSFDATQATHDSLNCNANIQQGDADIASDNELYVRGSGTAGTADEAVLTIQGITSMTPVIVTGDSAGSLTVDQATATNLKVQIFGDDITSAINTDATGDLQIDVATIAAGDNNIGNVDIVTLPSGNLGQQAMAASLSIVPASDITDTTYIGDIKFGEALPAGSSNIGDVDVLTQGMALARKESTQDLNVGALSYTTNFAAKTRVKQILFTASGSITQTVTFTFDSTTGATYDTVIASEDLVSETNYTYIPSGELILASGDEILIACTNSGTPAVNAYVTVIGETLN